MKIRLISTALLLGIFSSSSAFSEPVADIFIGKVQIRDSARLTSQAKKEIAVIAAKIKKSLKSGTVKLVGDVPASESPEEYLTKSVFLAKGVETHLAKMLSSRYQIFITASRYSNDKSAGKSHVSVYLYPYELKSQGLNFISSQLRPASPDAEIVSSPPPADAALSRPESETGGIRSKKELEKGESEDPAKANELVNRAKARAAEKARRREKQD